MSDIGVYGMIEWDVKDTSYPMTFIPIVCEDVCIYIYLFIYLYIYICII